MCEEEYIDIFDVIAEFNEEALSIQGYDGCIVGLCEIYEKQPVIAYDKRMMIDKLVLDGMEYDKAEEYFKDNILNSWAGEHSPVFITRLDAT